MMLLYKKFSMYEILQIVFPIFLTTFIFYILYLQNNQIIELTDQIKKVNTYSKDMFAKMLIKEAENQKLQKTINDLISAHQSKTIPDPSLVIYQNEFIKMFIQNFGPILLGGACVFLVYNLFNGFSFKKLIPIQIYTFLQNHTYFFQSHKTYNYTDIHNFKVIVDILNDKQINFINICDINNGLPENYVSLSKYILDIKQISQSSISVLSHVPTLTPKILDSAEICTRLFDVF